MTMMPETITQPTYTGEDLLGAVRDASLAGLEVNRLEAVVASEAGLMEDLLAGSLEDFYGDNGDISDSVREHVKISDPELASIWHNVSEQNITGVGIRSILDYIRQQRIIEATARRNTLTTQLATTVVEHYMGRQFHFESKDPSEHPITKIRYGSEPWMIPGMIFGRLPDEPTSVTARVWRHDDGLLHVYTGSKSAGRSKYDFNVRLLDEEANPLVTIAEA